MVLSFRMVLMKVLGICGSPRRMGNTALLLREFLRGSAEAGAKTTTIHLADYTVEGCIGCEQCRKDGKCTRFNDGMTLLYPLISDADALILGSPVYHYNVTSQMKACIDRLYAFYDFSNDRPRRYSSRLAGRTRRAAVFAIGEQADSRDLGFTLDALAWPLVPLGYEIMMKLPVLNCFEPGIVVRNKEAMEQAYQGGYDLADSFV